MHDRSRWDWNQTLATGLVAKSVLTDARHLAPGQTMVLSSTLVVMCRDAMQMVSVDAFVLALWHRASKTTADEVTSVFLVWIIAIVLTRIAALRVHTLLLTWVALAAIVWHKSLLAMKVQLGGALPFAARDVAHHLAALLAAVVEVVAGVGILGAWCVAERRIAIM